MSDEAAVMRVAILGGGIADLAAVFAITKTSGYAVPLQLPLVSLA